MRRLIDTIKADWRLTVTRHHSLRKLLGNYRYLRSRGFTRRAAWINAANVL